MRSGRKHDAMSCDLGGGGAWSGAVDGTMIGTARWMFQRLRVQWFKAQDEPNLARPDVDGRTLTATKTGLETEKPGEREFLTPGHPQTANYQ